MPAVKPLMNLVIGGTAGACQNNVATLLVQVTSDQQEHRLSLDQYHPVDTMGDFTL